MPRAPRLDIPGILQHVIVRGIERRDIFLDDEDKTRFVERLFSLMGDTGTQCFAWSLLSNHFHLLLKATSTPLSALMRRLLTGYAVVFNRKYNRAGHLFQNRYKSIVCEEEPYLLELVRYIHLNPLRAGLVANLGDLDKYTWSGHSVLMGQQMLEGQDTEQILGRFGKVLADARRRYRQFMADGVQMGRRDELVGGGLRRSRMDSAAGEYESFDERILGSGSFVESLKEDELLRNRIRMRLPLTVLIERICSILQLDPQRVTSPGKSRSPAEARAIICYLAVREWGYKSKDICGALRLGPTGVSRAVRRGEEFLAHNPDLGAKIAGADWNGSEDAAITLDVI